MWEYKAVVDVRPEELARVCRDQQQEDWNVEQITPRGRLTTQQISAPLVVFDIVFKRPSKEASHAQFLVNNAYGKLREAREGWPNYDDHCCCTGYREKHG
jgi:hypothetical protein